MAVYADARVNASSSNCASATAILFYFLFSLWPDKH